MPADERLRRLAPVAAGIGAVAVVIAQRRGVPDDAVLIAMIGFAAAAVAHGVGQVRGAAGVIAGVVCGVWLGAAAAGAAAAAAAATATAAAAAAGIVAMLARADRRDDGAVDRVPPYVAAPLAVVAVVMDPRAWALAAAAAALIVWREDGRRRWTAAAPAIAAVAGGVLTLLAATGRAPGWMRAMVRVDEVRALGDAVDRLGPVAMVAAVVGVGIAAAERRLRWTATAVVAALMAAVPMTAAPSGAAMVGVSVAMGVAVAGMGARVARVRDQVIVALVVVTVLVAPLAI